MFAISTNTYVNIREGSIVNATGTENAISGQVKNAIAGIGWTNTAGTEGEAAIAISSEGQTLTYKKVQFKSQHTHNEITFDPWTSADSLPTAGNYYLTRNVTVNSTTTVYNTLNLCLNGYGIQMKAEERVIFVGGNTLELFDCNPDKEHYVTLSDWRGIDVSDTGPESDATDGSGVVKVNGG